MGSFSLRIDNKPITEGKKAGVSSILAAMLGNGTTNISKDEFNDEIDFLGANLGFGASSAFASSLSKYSDRIIELMADAAINPLLTKEEFEKEKEKLIENLKSEEKSVDAVARRQCVNSFEILEVMEKMFLKFNNEDILINYFLPI